MTYCHLNHRFLLLACLFPLFLYAQTEPTDSLRDQLPQLDRQLVEDVIQDAEAEGDFEFNTAFENLAVYKDNPLNLNTADERTLRESRLLNDIQILDLLRYRREIGPLLAVPELQSIPSFDLETIRRLRPFVTVDRRIDDLAVRPADLLRDGKRELFIRWSRIGERQEGYRRGPEDGNFYLGDPNQYYMRFRHRYSNKFSFGFTAEKDRGEPFFESPNERGFDYYSAHLYVRDLNETIRAVALGDYAINLGQGLLLFTGFGYGKSIFVTSIKRSGRTVRPYTSVNEAAFMRGAAATFGLTENLELSLFASSRNRDANLVQPDTSEVGDFLPFITSLDEDGLHRTPAEIADRNALRLNSFGGNLRFDGRNFHVGLNSIYYLLDKPLQLTDRPYNLFYFRGDQLLNASVDYSYIWRNLHFFGETAYSDNGSIATVNGLLMGLDRRLDIALLFRHYPRDFQNFQARPFGETSNGRNETGLYIGMELRPHPRVKLSAYYDIWENPWLRFSTDAPGGGREYRARLTYLLKRRMELYAEVRHEVKDDNVPDADGKFNQIVAEERFQARLHFGLQITKALEWRSRIDWGFTDNPVNNRQNGFGVYQDLLFRPIQFPFSFTTRFALFDTDGFAVRFYNYENGLLYNFSVPAYYNRGSRFYLNVRFKGIRNMTIEGRIAQLFWSDQESVGSGLEATGVPRRTELGAQVKYSF